MKVQTLVAAMNQRDHSLLEKMNIQTDAIVGNQCDRNEIEEFEWNGNAIKYYSLAERGVGLNRATILNRADADVVLFADDDVVYYDGYAETVMRVYEEHPDADVVIFNMLESRDGEELHSVVERSGFVGRRGVSKFGMFCVSARLDALRREGISFNLLFGGGAEYSCGEDTIFLQDCVNKGLRVYTSTETLGTVIHGESTWYEGYTEKFFFDKGVLFATLYPAIAYPLSAYHVVKHRDIYSDYGVSEAFKNMCRGVKQRKTR